MTVLSAMRPAPAMADAARRGTGPTMVGAGAVFLWASGPSLATLGAHYGALPFVAGSLGFAFLVLLAARVARGAPLRPMLAVPPAALAIMVLGFFGHNTLFVAALSRAPAGSVTVISYLWPLVMVVLLPLFTGGRLSRRTLLGPGLGLAGVAVLVGPDLVAAGAAPGAASGYALAAGAALCFGIYSAARARLDAGPVDGAGTACGLAAVLAGSLHLVLGGSLVLPDAPALMAMLLIGAGPMGLAGLMWDHGVRFGDGRVLSACAYLTPVLSTALLVALALAVPDAALLAGGALVLAGIAMSLRTATLQPDARRFRSGRRRG